MDCLEGRRKMDYCVFEYHAEISIEDARKSLVCMVHQCLELRRPISKEAFDNTIPKLHYGTYPQRSGEDSDASLDALHWKYSELTGQYCGCQFWSEGAKRLFEHKLLEYANARTPTSNDARYVAAHLAKKTHGGQQLVHEHVFPRAELRKRLALDRDNLLAAGCLAATLERVAMGCVVLQCEHKLLKRNDCDYDNPWRRYTGKIKLAENQNWPAFQRELIVAAGLL